MDLADLKVGKTIISSSYQDREILYIGETKYMYRGVEDGKEFESRIDYLHSWSIKPEEKIPRTIYAYKAGVNEDFICFSTDGTKHNRVPEFDIEYK